MEGALTFSCGSCGRKHPWKKQLAGRQGKCKCGQILTVPSEPDPVDVDTYDLSELAADAERATKDLPPTIVEGATVTLCRSGA